MDSTSVKYVGHHERITGFHTGILEGKQVLLKFEDNISHCLCIDHISCPAMMMSGHVSDILKLGFMGGFVSVYPDAQMTLGSYAELVKGNENVISKVCIPFDRNDQNTMDPKPDTDYHFYLNKDVRMVIRHMVQFLNQLHLSELHTCGFQEGSIYWSSL